jgi:hypothetical protein
VTGPHTESANVVDRPAAHHAVEDDPLKLALEIAFTTSNSENGERSWSLTDSTSSPRPDHPET